jgi:hypothetical protein
MARKSKEATPHLRVRIEPDLLARLEKAREKSERTLTGEIVARLKSSFRREDNEAMLDRHGAAVAAEIVKSLGGYEPLLLEALVQSRLKASEQTASPKKEESK